MQDLSLAARMLAKRPGYTSVAAGTLALGIAAVVSIFTVVHAVPPGGPLSPGTAPCSARSPGS